ncbi:hypothetical protein DXG03_005028 [Asterophora parasitica]|uniref:Uncharacterized protein n=1 Tax=Asterophora parasitica TaxID=117018 RepID=A0A9P7KBL0_9AGAR|nr:hypothetical protein DXG03_005028 [Asterophora parasitica]
MRPSAIRLIRVLRRKSLPVEITERIIPAPAPQTEELKRDNLIDILMKQKTEAGPSWPANIRLEPVVKKDALKRVQADVRVRLKKLMKERPPLAGCIKGRGTA